MPGVLHIVIMRRHLLPLAILSLLLLVLADRVSDLLRLHQAAAEPVARESRSATPDLRRRNSASAAAVRSSAEAGDARLARLAAREALSRVAGSTYLD